MNYELVDFKEKINLDDLYHRKKQVEQNKIRVFQTILNRIHKKIKITSRQKYNDLFCFYIIPEFLVGVPIYDVAACTSYVINKLNQNGFIVRYTHPNLIFISWKKWIPEYKREEYRKKTGTRINGFGAVVKEKEIKLTKKPSTILIKKKPDEFKKIHAYKSTGTFLYDKNLLNRIENKIVLKK